MLPQTHSWLAEGRHGADADWDGVNTLATWIIIAW